jgi:acyl dehydratase
MSVKATDIAVGDTRELVLVEDLTRTRIVQYAGASGDYNPLHSDELFAREAAGFPTVFAHGMLTMGMTGRVLTDWVGDGRLTSYGVRFVGQVWPGDSLTATATVEAVRHEDGSDYADFKVATRNQRGEDVLTGTATARLG